MAVAQQSFRFDGLTVFDQSNGTAHWVAKSDTKKASPTFKQVGCGSKSGTPKYSAFAQYICINFPLYSNNHRWLLREWFAVKSPSQQNGTPAWLMVPVICVNSVPQKDHGFLGLFFSIGGWDWLIFYTSLGIHMASFGKMMIQQTKCGTPKCPNFLSGNPSWAIQVNDQPGFTILLNGETTWNNYSWFPHGQSWTLCNNHYH